MSSVRRNITDLARSRSKKCTKLAKIQKAQNNASVPMKVKEETEPSTSKERSAILPQNGDEQCGFDGIKRARKPKRKRMINFLAKSSCQVKVEAHGTLKSEESATNYRANLAKIEANELPIKIEKPKPANNQKSDTVSKKKRNLYGLCPGESPFPDFQMPTADAAYEVSRLLSEQHGAVEAPEVIPQPSLDVSGCGEVPSVLDAVIRTLLSAATTSKNSTRAYQGLAKSFGTYKDGVGKGSVNWNNVREATVEDVELAIRSGGLAKAKSKNIKKILDLVYENNELRKQGLLGEPEFGQTVESQRQKQRKIEAGHVNVLSLQHLHELNTEEARMELLKLPGVGVKVASCVILFCLQRPTFAVDTHCWRLCKWLGWVPQKASRDQTFSHCEVRIPDALKYVLHKLFVRHGRTCPRCTAIGTTNNDAKCSIDHLVTRTTSTR